MSSIFPISSLVQQSATRNGDRSRQNPDPYFDDNKYIGASPFLPALLRTHFGAHSSVCFAVHRLEGELNKFYRFDDDYNGYVWSFVSVLAAVERESISFAFLTDLSRGVGPSAGSSPKLHCCRRVGSIDDELISFRDEGGCCVDVKIKRCSCARGKTRSPFFPLYLGTSVVRQSDDFISQTMSIFGARQRAGGNYLRH